MDSRNEKTEITICLGSSCFARGNNQTLKVIKSYLKDHQLEDKVFFHGSHCFGRCLEGPILQINDMVYTQVDSNTVIDILTDYFSVY